MSPNWPDKSVVSVEIREKAFALLREGGRNALSEIQKMLGWEGFNYCMPMSLIAQKLGITTTKFHTLLYREEILKKNRQKREAELRARKFEWFQYSSTSLRFSITLPKECEVKKDTLGRLIDEKAAESILRDIEEKMPVDIRAPSPLPIIFLERETLTNRIKYESMVIGAFEAYKKTIHEDPSIEIVLLSLPQPMEAIELYKLTKPPHHFTPIGSRPRSGISVDGLLGVKYFFSYVIPKENKKDKWYRFLRVFLSENTDAWMISCSCSSDKFIQYRPVFDRIISSFKRGH